MEGRARVHSFSIILLISCLTLPVLGLHGSQSISSHGIIHYSSNLNYGLRIYSVNFPSYEDPIVEDLNWQELLTESGAKWIRFVPWGVYAGGLIDRFQNYLQILKNLNMKTLAVISKATMEDVGADFTAEDYGDYARQTATVFKGLLDAIEVWNEPDWYEYEYGYMDGTPEHYFDMLKAAYEGVKVVDPNIKVIGPGLMTLCEWGVPNRDGGTFLKTIWDLGAADYCDGVSIHTYQFWLTDEGITAGQAVEKAYNITGKPIYITEIGQPSSGNAYTEETQANWMEEKFTELNTATIKPELAIWHLFYGDDPFSVVYPDFREKQAYWVFKNFTKT